MFNIPHKYDLSFVSSSLDKRRTPQIVFTIAPRDLGIAISRLRKLTARNTDSANTYFDRHVEFTFFKRNLFGDVEFGYNSCGKMVHKDLSVELQIDLMKGGASYAAMTIALLTICLYKEHVKNGVGGNRHQHINLNLCCNSRSSWGHAVDGFLSEPITTWLKERGKKDGALPKEVLTSMREAWSALASAETKRWAKDCRGHIEEDGRFILKCFGDACDIAIYPDQLFAGELMPEVRFSCHNLDTAEQQMTLLAGLARICELARKSQSN